MKKNEYMSPKLISSNFIRFYSKQTICSFRTSVDKKWIRISQNGIISAKFLSYFVLKTSYHLRHFPLRDTDILTYFDEVSNIHHSSALV